MASRGQVAVIGMGNWGHSLAAALASCGLLAARVHASPGRRSAGRSGPAGAPPAWLDARVLWLCVPDAAIVETAAWIAAEWGGLNSKGLGGTTVVHSSGALDRNVLEAAERAGARTASVHPMMSFPTQRRVPLAGVRFGVEAAEAATQRRLFTLVRRLGGVPFRIGSGGKAMYHAGAMCGSPLLVALLAAGVDAMGAAGIGEREALALLTPMAAATIRNVERRGLGQSFSGPLARGDAATVKLHRSALAGHPLLAPVYDALARLAAEELPSAGRAAIRSVLDERARPIQKNRN